jgi:hypothetical protein
MVRTRTIANSEKALKHVLEVVLIEQDIAALCCEMNFENITNLQCLDEEELSTLKFPVTQDDGETEMRSLCWNSRKRILFLGKWYFSQPDVDGLSWFGLTKEILDNSSGVAKQVLQIRKYLCVHGDANGGNKTKGKTLDAETTAPAVVPLTANVPASTDI